jgi:hypothetical protein
MRVTPQRATLWADAYASVLRRELAPNDSTLDITDAYARATAAEWIDLRRMGWPITRSILTDKTADQLGLPDGKPQTIRNFLRGL